MLLLTAQVLPWNAPYRAYVDSLNLELKLELDGAGEVRPPLR